MRSLFRNYILPMLMIGLFFVSGSAHAGVSGILNAERELKNAGRPAFGQQAVEDTGGLAARVGQIINIFLTVVGAIFLLLMIYGGYLWMTARGDSDRVTKAKDTITSAIIGLVIVFAAYALTSFVVGRVIGATSQ